MLRAVRTALSVASVMALSALATVGGVFTAPHAHAEPQACPPTCDRIPSAAWPDPRKLPLYPYYRWSDLAAVATPVGDPARFMSEEFCGTPARPDDPRDYAVGARAVLGAGAGHWQLQVQILHWRGETWQGGEFAGSVFDAAVEAVRDCQGTAPHRTATIGTLRDDRLAAVVTDSARVLHQYLLADVHSSTVVELALWADQNPAVPWPAVSDRQVLDALAAPLCAAYLGSCG